VSVSRGAVRPRLPSPPLHHRQHGRSRRHHEDREKRSPPGALDGERRSRSIEDALPLGKQHRQDAQQAECEEYK
jgi:hypothetical protein